ncbi:MAG: tetratricopeptide repeat protein [Bacteroidota bacterium]
MSGGGGGSILGMIISYRENMKMRKKSIFNGREDFTDKRNTVYDSCHQKLETEKLSDEKRNEIRERTLRAGQRSRRRILFLFVPLLLVFSLATVLILSSVNSGILRRNKKMQEEAWERKMEYFDFCIANGDGWFERQKWEKAVDHYENALSVLPGDYYASYRLCNAYLNLCLSRNSHCSEAGELLNELIAAYPDKTELYELRAKYFLFTGEIELANSDFGKIDELKKAGQQQNP